MVKLHISNSSRVSINDDWRKISKLWDEQAAIVDLVLRRYVSNSTSVARLAGAEIDAPIDLSLDLR